MTLDQAIKEIARHRDERLEKSKADGKHNANSYQFTVAHGMTEALRIIGEVGKYYKGFKEMKMKKYYLKEQNSRLDNARRACSCRSGVKFIAKEIRSGGISISYSSDMKDLKNED